MNKLTLFNRSILYRRASERGPSASLPTEANRNIDPPEREQFRVMVEDELLGLHEGNFARYRIRPSEFEAWYREWRTAPAGKQ